MALLIIKRTPYSVFYILNSHVSDFKSAPRASRLNPGESKTAPRPKPPGPSPAGTKSDSPFRVSAPSRSAGATPFRVAFPSHPVGTSAPPPAPPAGSPALPAAALPSPHRLGYTPAMLVTTRGPGSGLVAPGPRAVSPRRLRRRRPRSPRASAQRIQRLARPLLRDSDGGADGDSAGASPLGERMKRAAGSRRGMGGRLRGSTALVTVCRPARSRSSLGLGPGPCRLLTGG
jgi:hypothetical protein